ncbi:hypothetical protein PV328_004002 [Microctonus aethiopoides]|uniref:Uncharacterized protein n=1 Tax=Microctonus aethiopoides TaxID=144406 RepID=A0AA39F9N5_9HYME|nr:hypothetical protein PV328_004002 [Microctonus aethiopoides]
MIELLKEIIADLVKGNDKFVERPLSNGYHQLSGILSNNANNVQICSILQNDSFAEFYGFEKKEVKDLLRKAGRDEDLNKVTVMYNGYYTKSNDGLDIEIYSPWVIIEYIYNEEVDNYWANHIPNKVRKLIGHPRIGKDVKSHGRRLGILRLINLEVDYLSLKIPNESVRQLIDLHLHTYDSIRAYYNHSPKLIHEFIESLKNWAQSCNKESARDLVNSVERLFTKGRTAPISEYEFHSILYTYILQHFGKYVVSERIASNRKRCDTVVFVEIHEVVIVFEFKLKRGSSNAGYKQIMNKQYYISLKKASLKIMSENDTLTEKKKIYAGLHMAMSFKTSITYLRAINAKPITVSSGAKNSYSTIFNHNI